MDFSAVTVVTDRMVTGNILVEKLVDSIEDSGFDVEDVQCSTKKSLEENLKSVWNLIHEQTDHEVVDKYNDDVFKVPNDDRDRRKEFDWFDDDAESIRSAKPEKKLRHSDSGIFKLSLDELSITEPANESSVKFHPEPEFHWNDGNVTTNAISEPWSFDNPYYMHAQSDESVEEITEECDDEDVLLEEKSLLARLPPRPPTPPSRRSRSTPPSRNSTGSWTGSTLPLSSTLSDSTPLSATCRQRRLLSAS